MLARVPTRRFSLDPLMKEARRRARQRRVLIGVGIALVAGAATGAVLLARSPGGGSARPPGSGSGSDGGNLSNVQASFKDDPTQPPVTPVSIAAAHRDEARMLGLFVPPPGARRVAYEPAFYQPRVKQILGRSHWGTGPQKSDRFARFAYWRIRASVAQVARFERAHRPAGSLTAGSYYASTETKTPRHGASDFTFSPIGSLVTTRLMQVWILRLASHQTAIRVAVSNSPWSPRSFRAALRADQVVPIVTREAPVAGQPFTGVTIIDVNPRIEPLKRVVCNATLGNHPLPAAQHAFTTSPPPGMAAGLARAEKIDKVEAVTCTWQIPANAAGDQLRLGKPLSGNSPLGGRLQVYTSPTPSHSSGGLGLGLSRWVVRSER